MKNYLMSFLALVLGWGTAFANPVDVNQAKFVGQQFVQANFEQSRQSADLTLVYTGTSTRGEACFYVFNVGSNGFVMVSADDFYRPIIGYSDERNFDTNINPELNYMLNELIAGRAGKLTGKANPDVVAEWQSVMNTGKLISRNGGREKFYLVQTRWDQNSPYNYYCPVAAGGPGGRAYAGCVATAMSQVMKYWDHPLQGTGSNSYQWHGQTLSANFGATTYDWDNMPNQIGNNSPQEQIQAVALLMYHCGIAVNMNYAYDGSGAYSPDVPPAIRQHFGYSNQANYKSRDSYTYAQWAQMLKESHDMGWPVYYSGQAPDGGHAFVCDGYDDNGFFHYNWGWSGSGDDYFDFDNIEYNSSDGAIFNFVPTDVYNNTPQAPTNLNVTPAPNNELSATVTWTNPSKTLNNSNMSSIDQIVVTRNNEIVYVESNSTPGASMSIVDNTVPRFDAFQYQVYAVYNGAHGKAVYQDNVAFGPSCGWTVNVTKAAFNGWRGGHVDFFNAAGTPIGSVTVTNSSVQSIPVDVPLGRFSCSWSPQTFGDSFEIGFTIKDSSGAAVYTYSGMTDTFPEGVFYEGNNGCNNAVPAECPTNIIAIRDTDNPNAIHVSWEGVSDPGYGYNVYRDNRLYRLIPNANSFIDENVPMGGHCYYVCVLGMGGENGFYSNESCATSGECYAPRNLDFEYTSNYKIKLKWEKPEPFDGLSGYYLFRKYGDDGVYERIKLLGANSTSYTDNTTSAEGHYFYKLYACYNDLGECMSAPANWIYDENQFFLHVYYSPTSVDERNDESVSIFPNPTTDRFTVNGENLKHVTVFNTVGQKVYDVECQGESVDINLSDMKSGIYLVRISTLDGDVTKRITVIR